MKIIELKILKMLKKNIESNISLFRDIYKFCLVFFLMIPISLVVRIIPRKETLWLFGTFTGKRYSDNARYLFEWVINNYQIIDAVWISKNKNIVNEIRSNGYRAEYAYSLNGIWLSIRAGFYFFCYTSSDINFWTSFGAKKINLWHGTPMKKIGWDMTVQTGRSFKALHSSFFRKIYYRSIFPGIFEQPDLLLSTSEFVSKRLKSAFRLSNEHVKALGYPVNDRLLSPAPIEGDAESIQLINHFYNSGKKIIAYLPTYRELINTDPGIEWKKLQDAMIVHDALFVIKLHPFDVSRWDLQAFPNILMLHHKTDIYPLMAITSALVTDYSSISIDYLLLDRPIFYFAYDIDEYISSDRGMYEGIREMAGGYIVKNFSELLDKLIYEVLEGQDMMQKKRAIMREKYHTYVDAKSNERICNYLLSQNSICNNSLESQIP